MFLIDLIFYLLSYDFVILFSITLIYALILRIEF